MNGLEVQDFLTGLAARLIDVTATDPFDRVTVREVGATLVAAHFTQPTTLELTLVALAENLPQATPGRLAQIQGALASGYTGALRDRVLSEQEEIRTAALSSRARAEEARWASEARFRAVFAEAAIGMVIAGVNGHITEVNGAVCEMLGYTGEELCQRRLDHLAHPGDPRGLRLAYLDLIEGRRDHLRVEKPFLHRDGRLVWTDLVISLIRDQTGQPRFTVTMVEDITERYLLQQRLRHQALHDPLTQLPNRTLFFERLNEILKEGTNDAGSRVGVCYLDVDGFKAINDTLGHDVGDQLLMAVAERLDQAVSNERQLVARMGGDEFVVLVDQSQGVAHVQAIAEAALAALRVPIYVAGNELSVSASVGIVERPVRGSTAAELMKAADTTLYWAKSDGRDRVALFDPGRHTLDVTRYELASAMPSALEREEFFIEYQPLVRLGDGAVTGIEALVRWNHPRLGVLGPDQFIPLAEETGLIVPLGRWVLREACQQGAIWLDACQEADRVISVNLSVRQIRGRRIVDDVAEILTSTGLDPKTLQLELTESALMGTPERLETLRELATLGVIIAIDDFGTGYSNFAYLRNLPVHALKLAGSFVAGLRPMERPDPVDEQIIAAVIDLAHALRLTVTAEGVETEEQATRLTELGCDTGQGWYYASPAPTSPW
ncbi:MAG: EAL domain-containing protein [Dactylosporangium sp.]|nr:EAL domain-containing protein [Dactylosporangium sp.]